MSTIAVHPERTTSRISATTIRHALLACGIVGGALYPLSDIIAATRYPGFSYRDMAVSELFAIGAPTSALVVTLFTISTSLLLLVSAGIWMSAGGRRIVRWIALLMALNAIDALTLWNFFPMHMRGEPRTFTDTMHGLLAIDPFLLAAVVLAAIAWPGWFRRYTIATVSFSTALALTAIWSVMAFMANQPTPWMGAAERAGQYATNAWYAVFAIMLLRRDTAMRG